MNEPPAAVFIVEDDNCVRESLQALLSAAGLAVEACASGPEFLERFDAERAACVLLNMRLPGMNGLELQHRLAERRAIVPMVFIVGHGDVPLAIEAMQHGAVDFVQKPFRDGELLARIGAAVERDRQNRASLAAPAGIRARIDGLTASERRVLERVAVGHSDRQIAAELALSPRSVEIHRAQLMEKMNACSLAHLVRMAIEAARTH